MVDKNHNPPTHYRDNPSPNSADYVIKDLEDAPVGGAQEQRAKEEEEVND
jgi:hypothetical protein